MSPSRPPEGDTSDSAPSAGPVPDRVVRYCSKCSRLLSVGERMFYFLEAVHAPCLCRICLLQQEQELLASPTPAEAPAPRGRYADLLRAEPKGAEVPEPRAIRGPVPIVAEDRIADSDGEIDPAERSARFAAGARRLRLAASRYVEEDRLAEAVQCIRELAVELAQVDSPPIFEPIRSETAGAEPSTGVDGTEPLGLHEALPAERADDAATLSARSESGGMTGPGREKTPRVPSAPALGIRP